MVTRGDLAGVGAFRDRRSFSPSELLHSLRIQTAKPFENRHVADEGGRLSGFPVCVIVAGGGVSLFDSFSRSASSLRAISSQ